MTDNNRNHHISRRLAGRQGTRTLTSRPTYHNVTGIVGIGIQSFDLYRLHDGNLRRNVPDFTGFPCVADLNQYEGGPVSTRASALTRGLRDQ